MFHLGNGVPPFPSGNSNQNSNLGSLINFPFGWNWNSTTPRSTQNVSLAYTGSSLQILGGNPSLGNVGGNAPLGTELSRNQGVPPEQQNIFFGHNPSPTQQLVGTLVSSQHRSRPI